MSNLKNKIAFPIAASLNRKIKSTVKVVNDNPDNSKAKSMLIDLINALIKEGLDYYFNHSLKVIGLNMTARKSIKVIVSPFKSAIQAIAKATIKKMDEKQLVATANFIDKLDC